MYRPIVGALGISVSRSRSLEAQSVGTTLKTCRFPGPITGQMNWNRRKGWKPDLRALLKGYSHKVNFKKRERNKIGDKKENLLLALGHKRFMHQTVKAESGSPVKIFSLDQKTFQSKEHTHHIKSPTSYVSALYEVFQSIRTLTKATPSPLHLLILMRC